MDKLYFLQSKMSVTPGFTLYATTGAERAQKTMKSAGREIKIFPSTQKTPVKQCYKPSVTPSGLNKSQCHVTYSLYTSRNIVLLTKIFISEGGERRIGASCGEAEASLRGSPAQRSSGSCRASWGRL